MTQTILGFISTILGFLIIDGVWLATMSKRFYASRLGNLMADKPQLTYALAFYLIYATAVSILIVHPAVAGKYSSVKTFLTGALFGLAAYGTYDLTNQATLKNWPLSITVVDLIWGSVLTGLVAVIAVYVVNRFS